MTSAVSSSPAIRKRRPILRRIGLGLLAIVVLYGSFAVYLATRPVVISFDALQRFRDALPRPAKPEDAAWPAYRDALKTLGFADGAIQAQDVREALGCRPGDAKWKVLAAWVDANQPALAAARAASKRPVFGFPVAGGRTAADDTFFAGTPAPDPGGVDWKDRTTFPMLSLMLPQMGASRSLSHALVADMFRAVEQGDGARATDDLEAIMSLSAHVMEGRILIGDLVGMAIRRVGVTAVIGTLEWKPEIFTDDQLRRMQVALRSMPTSLERMDLSMERLMFEDAVQRFFSDDGHGDGWFVPTWRQMGIVQGIGGVSAGSESSGERFAVLAFGTVLRPVGSVLVAGRRETLAHYAAFTSEVEGASVGTPREALAKIAPIDARQELQHSDGRQRARYFLESLLGPALGQAAVNFAVDRASRESACAVIAAELFHRANKRWPANAAELAAFNGGVAPADPWGEDAIRMAEDTDGFRMWSIGRDGKDDGGVMPAPDQPGDARALSSTLANQPAEGNRTIDWVWFAPRGNLDRWRN